MDTRSLAGLRRLFVQLDPPQPHALTGFFRGHFVGPAWLLLMWPPLLAITGLGGWRGKRFDGQGGAVNLVRRSGVIETRYPMVLSAHISALDGKPGLALHYRRANPFPWPWIVDELRQIDANNLLGMTAVALGPLRKVAFPFILERRETIDGL